MSTLLAGSSSLVEFCVELMVDEEAVVVCADSGVVGVADADAGEVFNFEKSVSRSEGSNFGCDWF